MTSDTSGTNKTSPSETRWRDPRLLAGLVAMITVPCAAFLAVVAHVSSRILTTGVFLVGFFAPIILLWRQNNLDRPLADKPPPKPEEAVGECEPSETKECPPSAEENPISVEVQSDVKNSSSTEIHHPP